MNDDGQVPTPEAASLDGEFKAGSESPAQAGRGSVWICSLPRSGGKKHEQAKPLKGFGSAGVLEVTEDWGRSTYRAVYTVRFKAAVFVLHMFQKKSTRGTTTPKADIDPIRERLKIAEQFAKELLP
jgi:phage-related protein